MSVKEEEITPLQGIPTDPPHNSEEQLPVMDEPSPKRVEDIDGGHKVILQRWRAHDLADNGQTEIADQGIFIDNEGNAFINKEQKKSLNPLNPGAPKQLAPRATSTATRAANILSGGPPDGGPPNEGWDEEEVAHLDCNVSHHQDHQAVEDHPWEMDLKAVMIQEDLRMTTMVKANTRSDITCPPMKQ
ncbi:hypothetical protein IW262DRAFT_1465755 [Armillaria fumosa]|nr:hypothetical protein IW262DRAFT_1465755 [Armillaria fumosa]